MLSHSPANCVMYMVGGQSFGHCQLLFRVLNDKLAGRKSECMCLSITTQGRHSWHHACLTSDSKHFFLLNSSSPNKLTSLAIVALFAGCEFLAFPSFAPHSSPPLVCSLQLVSFWVFPHLPLMAHLPWRALCSG